MAKDTERRTRPTSTVGATDCPVHNPAPCPAPAGSLGADAQPRRTRRKTRPWTLVLFVLEVAVVVALVWFSWSGGSWA